jgi:hypothetical protein
MAISRLGLAGAWGQLKQIRFNQVRFDKPFDVSLLFVRNGDDLPFLGQELLHLCL